MPELIKVFISWSDEPAKSIALAIGAWLPKLSDYFDTWVSDSDIEPGARSTTEITEALQSTSFGIVIVTESNQSQPWLNFETGALSKAVEGEKTRVVPLLFGEIRPANLQGPLSTFQAKRFAKESEFRSLIKMLGSHAGVNDLNLLHRYELSLPELQGEISMIMQRSNQRQARPAQRDDREILEEILLTVRTMQSQSSSHTVSTPDRVHLVEEKVERVFSQLLDEPRVASAVMGNKYRLVAVNSDGRQTYRVEFYDRVPESIAKFLETRFQDELGLEVTVGTRRPPQS